MNTESAATVVQTSGLTKRYASGVTAVSGLDLRIATGEIYGFVGRNGAGKTTTMRMLVGLIRPSAGSALLLGRPLGDPATLARVGSLIESPAFQPHLSGLENLRLLARYLGLPDGEVDRVLGQVQLVPEAAARKFRTYSLGMKQRLGVAAALLGDPELLILDEPTNGLDPAGMAAMRDLLRSLAAQGRTVLLSSHLLAEVEQICDRVGILHEGRLKAEGTVAEIQAHLGGGVTTVTVRVEQPDTALACLRGLPDLGEVRTAGDLVEIDTDGARAVEINRALVLAGAGVSELVTKRRSLEEAFLGLTQAPDAAGIEAPPAALEGVS